MAAPSAWPMSAKLLKQAEDHQRSADTYAAFGYAGSARVLQAKADRLRSQAEVQSAAELERSLRRPGDAVRWSRAGR